MCPLDFWGLTKTHTTTQDVECGDWLAVESIVDSGAARSVCPIHFCDNFGTQKPPNGVVEHFKTATGARVPNEGRRTIKACGDDGSVLSTTYSVADIAVPPSIRSAKCATVAAQSHSTNTAAGL